MMKIGKIDLFDKLTAWAIVFLSVPAFIISLFGAYEESLIWVNGETVTSKIVTMSQQGPDKYIVKYKIDNEEVLTKLITKKAYNKLKGQTVANLIYWKKEKPQIIFLDLEERNQIYKSFLSVVIFGLLSLGGVKKLVRAHLKNTLA